MVEEGRGLAALRKELLDLRAGEGRPLVSAAPPLAGQRSARRGELPVDWRSPLLGLALLPQTQVRLGLGMKRFVHEPSLAPPW